MPPRLLEGVQGIDLTWILVGPGATRLLASMSVEVMRLAPIDLCRVDLWRVMSHPASRIPLALLKTPTVCPAQWMNALTVAPAVATMSTKILSSTASLGT